MEIRPNRFDHYATEPEETMPSSAKLAAHNKDKILAQRALAKNKDKRRELFKEPCPLKEYHRKRKQQTFPSSSSGITKSPSSIASTVMQDLAEPTQMIVRAQPAIMQAQPAITRAQPATAQMFLEHNAPKPNGKQEVSDSDESGTRLVNTKQKMKTQRRILTYGDKNRQVLNSQNTFCNLCGSGKNGFCNDCYNFHINMLDREPELDVSASDADETSCSSDANNETVD
jgi:hypothetical protein